MYTRKGDTGLTNLGDGSQLSKADVLFSAAGAIDELNASLGLFVSLYGHNRKVVQKIQDDLCRICFDVLRLKINYESIKADVAGLESDIDTITASLPPGQKDIIPGGTAAASQLHVCRSICRRAERAVVNAMDTGAIRNVAVVSYLNRLSDFLLVMAKLDNNLSGIPDSLSNTGR